MPSSIQICIKIGYSYRYGGATEIWRFLENILALFDAEDLATLCAVDLCSVTHSQCVDCCVGGMGRIFTVGFKFFDNAS